MGILLFVAFVALIILDFQVRGKFEGKKWRLPSLVYGRPVELYVGKVLHEDYLRRELLEAGYEYKNFITEPGQFRVSSGEVEIYRRAFDFWDGRELALPISIRIENSIIEDLSIRGEPKDLIRLEPMLIGGMYPHSFEDRKLVQLEQVPQYLKDALIAVEDQGFYDHWGVSPKGIIRATYRNIRAGRVVEGASTLTQQLVKNFYLSSERSIRRKAMEAVYSLLLELHYSKDEILETYLNEVYLAQNGNRAIHGFGLASEFYFNKSIEDLTLSDSAMLVALVNGPSFYNPRRHPERCKTRRDKVLRMLFASKKISKEEYESALAEQIKIPPVPKSKSIRYPGYIELVKRHLDRDYRSEDLQGEGLRIFTAFDPHSQWAAEEAVDEVLRRMGRSSKKLETAVVVSSSSGDVEALIGSKTSGYQGFNRALDSKRSIGSLVKPAILIAALESGNFDLSTNLDDSEITLEQEGGKVWQPKNYDGESHGDVAMYRAMAKSYNQAMVRLGLEIGPESVAEVLSRLGAQGELPTNPAMLLGSFGLSPFEVMTIFQTISSDGFQVVPRSVRYVMDYKGEVLKSFPLEIKKVFSPEVLHLAQYALQLVMYEGTGKSAYNTIPTNLRSAGKTGTSNGLRDSWFSGFTGDKLAVVWMGHDNHSKTGITGSSGALQVWSHLMKGISRRPLSFQKPQGVDYYWVDEESGAASFPFCQGVRSIPFMDGRKPSGQSTCIKSLEPVVDWFKKMFE